MSTTDSDGTYTCEYDTRDRLTRETKANGWALSYDYDAAGNRTTLATEVDGITTSVGYTYEKAFILSRSIQGRYTEPHFVHFQFGDEQCPVPRTVAPNNGKS